MISAYHGTSEPFVTFLISSAILLYRHEDRHRDICEHDTAIFATRTCVRAQVWRNVKDLIQEEP